MMTQVTVRRSDRLRTFAYLAALALAAVLFASPLRAQAPDTLTLDEAVRLALTGSPEVRSAQAQQHLGRTGRIERWAALVPSVSLSTGLNQNSVLQRTATDPITGGIIQLPDSVVDVREAFGTSAQVNATWTVFDGGRRVWGMRRARAEARAADLSYEAARARVAAGLTTAYVNALESAALAQTRAAELERAQELVRLAQGRFDAGVAPELDVLQARVSEGDADLALADAESLAETARLSLFAYLPDVDPSGAVLAEPVGLNLEALPTTAELQACAVEQSTELAALRAQLSAARRDMEMQRTSLLPSIWVGATWIRSEFGQTRDAITLDPRNEQTYYRVGLSWAPLDQPGQLLAERRRAAATLQMADAQLAARQAVVTREVTAALDRLRRFQQQETRRRLNLELAQLQRMQAEERYKAGAGSIVERFQAEALAREAERQALIGRYAALRAVSELERAGGVRVGWQTGTWSCN